MESYYKYLTPSEDDAKWGLTILTAGYQSTLPGEEYPSAQHPAHHYFKWNNGRILNEYQLVYISNGSGVFESVDHTAIHIITGSLIILKPGIWHRYQPSQETGWQEYWVGFQGNMASEVFGEFFFDKNESVFNIGYHERIINLYKEILGDIEKEKAAYQQKISGALMHLLGLAYYFLKNKNFENTPVASLVGKAKVLLSENLGNKYTPEDVALSLGVGYSWLRKAFKQYTGMAPGNYQQQIRLQKARELLAYTNKPVKEISGELGYESIHYFSRLFFQKEKISPTDFRKKFKV